MLSCLPGLTSDSTTNGAPGSGSTDSVGSTGSTSDGSVTHWRRRGRGAAADGRRDGVQRWWRRGSAGVPEMMNRSSLAATMEVVTALVEGQKGARVSAKGGARAQWRRKGRPVRIRPGGGRTRHGSRRWPARGDACGAQRGKTEREGRGG